MADRKGSNGASRVAQQNGDTAEPAAAGAPRTLADADAHEALVYIMAMLKPLSEMAKSHEELDFLAFLLEMSVLEAAELESKHRKPRQEHSASV